VAETAMLRHHPRMHRPIRRVALGLVVATALAVPGLSQLTAARAAAADFPAGFEGFHTYAEIGADAAAVEAAHPEIAHRFSIGKSYLGRELWAMKISDHVATDEAEPEVLFDGGTHSDEHMGVEMTLKIMHWLVDGYGTDPRITRIVDTREIWLVFSVNPDGAAHDIAGGKFHFWRKNRQPNAGTTAIGTDLNRNFGYRWGGGGKTSTNPAAITYRGPKAFSAPETRAMRDFLASRVVGGVQQIRTHITFHEYGRLVMWPYGYTYTNVPFDMTTADHDALVKIGKVMAASNGYRPEQASDLYITSGTTRDYAYGTYRIFSYTFEMSTKDYPDDSLIPKETGRNKEAVLYLMERAWCPLSVISSATTTARCGAFDDDLEVARGWTVDPDGTDTALASTSGRFSRSNPSSTSSSGAKQLGTTASGSKAFVTGAPAGSSSTAYDLDGSTSIRSRAFSLPTGAGQRLTFRYVFAHTASSTTDDSLRAIIERADGTKTVVFTKLGSPVDVDGAWTSASIPLDAWAGQQIRIRFEALEGGAPNLLEVELDDIRVTRPS
jgi:carboxypeptidase T